RSPRNVRRWDWKTVRTKNPQKIRTVTMNITTTGQYRASTISTIDRSLVSSRCTCIQLHTGRLSATRRHKLLLGRTLWLLLPKIGEGPRMAGTSGVGYCKVVIEDASGRTLRDDDDLNIICRSGRP